MGPLCPGARTLRPFTTPSPVVRSRAPQVASALNIAEVCGLTLGHRRAGRELDPRLGQTPSRHLHRKPTIGATITAENPLTTVKATIYYARGAFMIRNAILPELSNPCNISPTGAY